MGLRVPSGDLASVSLQLMGAVLTSTSKTKLGRLGIHAIAKGMWRSLIKSKTHSKDRN